MATIVNPINDLTGGTDGSNQYEIIYPTTMGGYVTGLNPRTGKRENIVRDAGTPGEFTYDETGQANGGGPSYQYGFQSENPGASDYWGKIISDPNPKDSGTSFLNKVFGTGAALVGGAAGLGALGGEAVGGGAFGGSALDVGAGIPMADGLTAATGAATTGAATGATNMAADDWFDPNWADEWSPQSTGGAFGNTVTDANAADWGIDNTGFGNDEALSGSNSVNQDVIQQIKDAVNKLPPGAQSAAKAMLDKLTAGDMSGLQGLIKMGLPLALAAGVLEKNTNPLTGVVRDAAGKAISSVGAFGDMSAVGMQPSSKKAIDLANSSTGAWQPYLDKAAAYTNEAAAGIPSVDLSTYMNPYIDNVLTPQVRAINLSADQERQRLAHLARISGNDTYATPGSSSANRYGVEEGTLNDNRMKQIGDATGIAYKGAFDDATGLATTDLNRKATAGGAFNTMAGTVGTQTGGDITRLAAAGDLEAKPQQNALDHAADTAKLYTSVVPGTSSAITATNQPSTLGQAVGAFGAYNAADKLGLLKP